MNYDIPEIQSSREKLEIGDKVTLRGSDTEFIIIDNSDGFKLSYTELPNCTLEGNLSAKIEREDLIWIPSTDDLIKLMGIHASCELYDLCHETAMYYFQMGIEEVKVPLSLKDELFRTFMFTKGKVLKNGKWEAM